jgi:hypothetical protein
VLTWDSEELDSSYSQYLFILQHLLAYIFVISYFLYPGDVRSIVMKETNCTKSGNRYKNYNELSFTLF